MTWKTKPGVKLCQLVRKKTQNWIHLETEIACNILLDSELNFCYTLEKKALKKSSNKDVFEALQKEFPTVLLHNDFLDTAIEKLGNQYNNIKKNWRKNVDCARTSSGLDVMKESTWIVIDSLSSSALDFSFQEKHLLVGSSNEKNDEEKSDNENESVLSESKLQEESEKE